MLALKHILPLRFAHHAPRDEKALRRLARLRHRFGDIANGPCPIAAAQRDFIADMDGISCRAVCDPDTAVGRPLDAGIVVPDDDRAFVATAPKASVGIEVQPSHEKRLHRRFGPYGRTDQRR